jgi:CHASE3 domain sensor protein
MAEDRITDLENELDELRREFQKYRQQKAEEESRRLRTALIWAGGVILALAGFMWSEIIWPALKIAKGGTP